MLKEKEYYIEHGKANIALKTDIEKTADLVCAEGFPISFLLVLAVPSACWLRSWKY